MKIEQVPIGSVQLLARNPRRHPQKQLVEMQRSVEQFGQYRPLVVDETGTILAGNGLYQALQAMGRDTVAITRVTGLNPDQKSKLILADNRLNGMSIDDFDVIEQMLAEMSDFEIPGYDAEALADLIATADEALSSAQQYGVLPDAARERLRGREPAEAGDTEPPPPSDDGDSFCPTCKRPW